MIPLDDIPNTQPLVRTDPDLSEWTAAMPWSKIDHDIKNYTKYEFGYNFLLKSPFLFIISIAP